MEWVQLFIASAITCFPFYIIGAIVGCFVWYFTRRWHVFPRVLIRSLFLALVLAPGVVIGHGFAPVPAVLAVLSNVVDDHRMDTAFQSSVPIIIVWLACAALLFFVAHFTNKTADDHAA